MKAVSRFGEVRLKWLKWQSFLRFFSSSSYFRFVMEVRGWMHIWTRFSDSAYQNTSILTYFLPYFGTYHKVEKPEIAFSSETGSKADIRNSSTLLHVESITDHFNTQLGYVHPRRYRKVVPRCAQFLCKFKWHIQIFFQKFPKHFNSDLSMRWVVFMLFI